MSFLKNRNKKDGEPLLPAGNLPDFRRASAPRKPKTPAGVLILRQAFCSFYSAIPGICSFASSRKPATAFLRAAEKPRGGKSQPFLPGAPTSVRPHPRPTRMPPHAAARRSASPPQRGPAHTKRQRRSHRPYRFPADRNAQAPQSPGRRSGPAPVEIAQVDIPARPAPW